ncbi:hypothetical protein [Kineococcus sp. SYSU DK002]|uniref:hypothetical protein n=1 Tax=Kineococcus sp. SYSU DK002 TaxID=3383123 RepID=UPI003D7DC642
MDPVEDPADGPGLREGEGHTCAVEQHELGTAVHRSRENADPAAAAHRWSGGARELRREELGDVEPEVVEASLNDRGGPQEVLGGAYLVVSSQEFHSLAPHRASCPVVGPGVICYEQCRCRSIGSPTAPWVARR